MVTKTQVRLAFRTERRALKLYKALRSAFLSTTDRRKTKWGDYVSNVTDRLFSDTLEARREWTLCRNLRIGKERKFHEG